MEIQQEKVNRIRINRPAQFIPTARGLDWASHGGAGQRHLNRVSGEVSWVAVDGRFAPYPSLVTVQRLESAFETPRSRRH